MRILRNYIIRELTYPLLMSLFTLTFIFLVGNLVKIADLILNKGVDFFGVLYFLYLIIPEMIVFTLPTSVLAAILLVFGDLAENNEIIAVRANGINIFRIMLPVMVLGFILSALVLVVNDQILPEYSFKARKTVKSLFIRDPFAYLKPGVPAKILDNYIFIAREIDGEHLGNVTIYEPMPEGPTRTILAETCQIDRLENNTKMRIRLFNGTIDEPDENDAKVFNKLDFEVYELPIIDIHSVENIGKKTREFSIDQLYAKLKTDKNLSQDKKKEYKIEIHKKIAFSFGCFVFTLIGLPLAVITKKGNMLLSFGISIMVITAYYLLFSWAQVIAIQGLLPPAFALWLPIVIFFAIGIYLIRGIVRG